MAIKAVSPAGFKVLEELYSKGASKFFPSDDPLLTELMDHGLIKEQLTTPWPSSAGIHCEISVFGRQVLLNLEISRELIKEALHRD